VVAETTTRVFLTLILYGRNWPNARLVGLILYKFVRTLYGMKTTHAGRPPKGDKPMGERLEIRLETGEKELFDRAAKAANMDRSEWIRATLTASAKRLLPKSARGR
jgi:hypothetical protein